MSSFLMKASLVKTKTKNQKEKSSTAEEILDFVGGANGVRTRDLIVANDALSQLSYSPNAE